MKKILIAPCNTEGRLVTTLQHCCALSWAELRCVCVFEKGVFLSGGHENKAVGRGKGREMLHLHTIT